MASGGLHLAAAGYSVVVNDLGAQLAGEGRDASPAHHVVAEITSSGGIAVAHCGDVGTRRM